MKRFLLLNLVIIFRVGYIRRLWTINKTSFWWRHWWSQWWTEPAFRWDSGWHKCDAFHVVEEDHLVCGWNHVFRREMGEARGDHYTIQCTDEVRLWSILRFFIVGRRNGLEAFCFISLLKPSCWAISKHEIFEFIWIGLYKRMERLSI